MEAKAFTRPGKEEAAARVRDDEMDPAKGKHLPVASPRAQTTTLPFLSLHANGHLGARGRRAAGSLPTQCRTASAPHSSSRRRRPSSSPTAHLRAGDGARAAAAST